MSLTFPNGQLTRWLTIFEGELTRRFESDPMYAHVKAQTTPREYAERFTQALRNGGASKDGKAVIATCKALGVKHTYKAIATFLNGEPK